MDKEDAFISLSDDDYAKAIGQFRLQVGVVLSVFDLYGMGAYIPLVVTEITKLAEDFGLRVRGVDKPIDIDYVRRRKKSKKTAPPESAERETK